MDVLCVCTHRMYDLINSPIIGCLVSIIADYSQLQMSHLQTPHPHKCGSCSYLSFQPLLASSLEATLTL